MRKLLPVIATLFLVLPATSQAARFGKVLDPANDQTPFFVGQNNDIKSVKVAYFPKAGILQGTVRTNLHITANQYYWYNFYANVGRHRRGKCDLSHGVRTHFYTPDDAPGPPAPPDAQIAGFGTITGLYSAVFSPGYTRFRTDTYTFADPRLKHRNYNCVTGVRLDALGGTVDTVDTTRDFRLR